MVFSSTLFLCIFFPVTLLLYFIVPKFLRNTILLVVSLLFYAWGEPKYVGIMLFSTVFDFTNGLLIEKFCGRPAVKKVILILSVTVNLGILCFFKYTDFALKNISSLLGTNIGPLRLALPIGISFYTFQTLSYTIDVYRGRTNVQHNILDFGMYICLFPQLIAGPIVRYADVEQEIHVRRITADGLWHGLVRFTVGLGKKVLLANQIGILFAEISKCGVIPAATAWIGIAAFTFQIYFDFSGYSDMAIGLGEILGFHFPENFRHPYESASITDFWRRWHITLGVWFREYLYIPLGGNRRGTARQFINLLAVWSLTGLWHGAGWNFLLWGLFYFALLILEKFYLLKKMEWWPKVFRHVYVIFFTLIGWTLFSFDDMGALKQYIISFIGANGLGSRMSLYYLATYGPLFAVLGLASTHYPAKLASIARNRLKCEPLWLGIETLFVTVVSALCVVFLVGDSYNPFLYFRF